MSDDHAAALRRSDRRIIAPWIALAFLWGTTWLAIRISLEDLPPYNLAAVRFDLAAHPPAVLIKPGLTSASAVSASIRSAYPRN